jgi:hypothetical protein
MNSGINHGAVKGEGKSKKRWNTMSIVAPGFIWVAGDGRDDLFP